jgi:hypothetical protein
VNLEEIRHEVLRLSEIVGAEPHHLPTFGLSDGSGRAHVEVDSRGYHYVCAERGVENSRVTTESLDELLFHVMKDVCFGLAVSHAAAHRRRGEDSRRRLFSHTMTLMSQFSPEWADRQGRENADILRYHPFDDKVELRADLSQSYRAQGHSPEAAWEMACRRFPLPEEAVT